jgi:hypothetical protein
VFDLFRRRGFQSARAVALEAGWHGATLSKVKSVTQTAGSNAS